MKFEQAASDGNGESAWIYVCDRHAPTLEREYVGATEPSCLAGAVCEVEGCEGDGDNYFTFYAKNHLVVSNGLLPLQSTKK